jgi:hypothetical protein
MDFTALINVANFTLAIINFLVATLLVFRGFRVSRDISGANTTASDQYAYQELLDTRDTIETVEQAERFYDRFWAGQILQFEHWQNRLIPDLIYSDWMLKRRQQYEENLQIGGIGFQEAWQKRLSERYSRKSFGKFMNQVLTGEPSLNGDLRRTNVLIERAMRRARGWF